MRIFKTKKCIVFICITLVFLTLIIRHIYCSNAAFYMPEYAKTDVSELVHSEALSYKDYETIFKNTGVSPGVVRELIKNKDFELLDRLNELYFKEPKYKKEYISSPVTVQEKLQEDIIPLVPLKKGDILITFNTHTLDWRHGHCGLVLSENGYEFLEHTSIGNKSCINYTYKWGTYPCFVVLRHKDSEYGKKAADYAMENLVDIEYDLFVGIKDKDMSDNTSVSSQCAHIVWQAYKAVGKDIDENGGMIVTPHDIAMSEELKVVQIFGINPDEYHDRILR